MDQAQSVTAGAAGTATTTMGPIPTGVQWTVWQISVETNPARAGSSVVVRKNFRIVSSAALSLGAASAQAPPALVINPGDLLTATWAGMTAGDNCLVTWFYSEAPWSSRQPTGVV